MRAITRVLAAAAVSAAWAALTVPGAAAQVQVSLRPLAPVEALYVADILPGSGGSRPDFLGITLFTAGDPTTPQTSRASVAQSEIAGPTVVLELTVAREDPSPIEIFRGTTDPFVIKQPVLHLTLRDLTERGNDVSITQSSVNEDAVEGAVRSGRLPAGTYVFTVTLYSERGGKLASDDLRLALSQPTRVELLSPGAPADEPPPTVAIPTPRFVWSGDGGAPGTRYRLRVSKVDDSGNALDAVQSGFPAWDTFVTGTSAVYPASVEALRLEPGATYAWQVTREVDSSGGREVIESPVYWFRASGAGMRGGAEGLLDDRFAALLRALGLTELEGFSPVGATLEDGRALPLRTLEELLAAIVAGEVSVMSVRVR